jgi:hypothetical protein
MEPSRQHWIPVTTSAGMFSAEYAISLHLASGQVVSFFADRHLVKEESGRSLLQVTLVKSDPVHHTDRVLLPAETFETASRWVEVPMEQQPHDPQ